MSTTTTFREALHCIIREEEDAPSPITHAHVVQLKRQHDRSLSRSYHAFRELRLMNDSFEPYDCNAIHTDEDVEKVREYLGKLCRFIDIYTLRIRAHLDFLLPLPEGFEEESIKVARQYVREKQILDDAMNLYRESVESLPYWMDHVKECWYNRDGGINTEFPHESVCPQEVSSCMAVILVMIMDNMRKFIDETELLMDDVSAFLSSSRRAGVQVLLDILGDPGETAFCMADRAYHFKGQIREMSFWKGNSHFYRE